MPKASELVDDEIRPAHRDEPSRTATNGCLQVAQVLAFVALVAALVGALGPAEDVRSIYSWPPSRLPQETPRRTWYTPLLLIKHRAESISASVPCTVPPSLPDAERPTLLLSTARFPERNGGLALTHEGGEMVVKIGGDVVARANLPAEGASKDCVFRLRLAGGRLSLKAPGGVGQTSALAAMPVVSGLFSALDLRSGTPPSIDVTTAVHATQPRLHQKLAWTLAVVCALAALLLVVLESRPRPWIALRSVLAHAHPVDAVVGLVLLGWWVLSPAFHDDGWVIARQRTFSSSGGFASYYNAFGTNLPNDYWLEWAQHWLVESTSALLWLRIPSLLCLAAVWVLCRWIHARMLASSESGSVVALWALATVFLVGALAWGMTLRPEPVSALFVTAVFACAIRFVERGTAAPLALLAVLLPLALTGHHASVVAFAPLIVVSPILLRWARIRIAAASTIVAAAIALLAVLLFVGSDLEQRRTDAETVATHTGVSWRSEILRYEPLGDFPFATPLRRMSVALIGLAVLAFLLRHRREKQPLLDLPSASLGVALLLLIASPSKLPWHFGALLGIVALAAAAETTRLRDDAAATHGWRVRPLIAIGAAIFAAAWAWSPRSGWSTADLRTYDWAPEASLVTLGVVLPIALLGGAVLAAVVYRNAGRSEAPWRVASLAAPMLVVPMLLFTVAVLAADAAKTEGWTLARQNLGAFTGDVGCGLADDLLVPARSSMRPLDAAETGELGTLPPWVPPTPLGAPKPFVIGPAGETSTASPWYELRGEEPFGLYVSGTPRVSDRLALEWSRVRGGEIQGVQTDEISRQLFLEVGAVLPWRLLAAGELPAPPLGARAVRLTLRSEVGPSAAVAVTAPIAYATEPLAGRLSGESRPLVLPNLVTYFPCVELPRLGSGIAEVPTQILVPGSAASPVRESATSPFAGVLDLYRLERLPLADSANPPGDFVVFGVDRQIPGAAQAAPTVTASTSG